MNGLLRIWGGFLFLLAAMTLAVLFGRAFQEDVAGKDTVTLLVGFAAIVQAGVATVMMVGLRHARSQAEAANETLKLADLNGRRQLRAYLDVERANFSGFKADVVLEIALRNFGQTPARIISSHVEARVIRRTARAAENFFSLPLGGSLNSITVVPGAPTRYFLAIAESQWRPDIDDLLGGAKLAAFRLVIVYDDVFDTRHTLRLMYASRDFNPEDGENLQLVRRDSD